MKKDYVHLEEEGLPFIRLYRNGRIYNERTARWLNPTKVKAHLFIQVCVNYKPYSIAVSLMIRKYFWNYLKMFNSSDYKRIVMYSVDSHYYVTRSGSIWDDKYYRFAKQSPNDDGYLRVQMTINGIRKAYFVHRLVAESFIGNPDKLPEVNHIDGDKSNNWGWNLEWSDRVSNLRHARLNNLRKAALTEEQVHAACVMLNMGVKINHIAKTFNTHKSNIQNLRRGTYRYITEQYGIQLTDKCKTKGSICSNAE